VHYLEQHSRPHQTPSQQSQLPNTIADLWNPNSNTWNNALISNIFTDSATHIISQLQPIPSQEKDIIRWTPAPKGICTAKEAFIHLNSQNRTIFPTWDPEAFPTKHCKSSKELGNTNPYLRASKPLLGDS